jgi:hypothetical protein
MGSGTSLQTYSDRHDRLSSSRCCSRTRRVPMHARGSRWRRRAHASAQIEEVATRHRRFARFPPQSTAIEFRDSTRSRACGGSRLEARGCRRGRSRDLMDGACSLSGVPPITKRSKLDPNSPLSMAQNPLQLGLVAHRFPLGIGYRHADSLIRTARQRHLTPRVSAFQIRPLPGGPPRRRCSCRPRWLGTQTWTTSRSGRMGHGAQWTPMSDK